MDSRQVIYLSLVFSAFFIGQLLGLGPIIGAPLSLVVLAYVSPKLSRKVIVEVFMLLMIGNVVLDFPSWLMFFTTGQSFLSSVGASMDWYIVLVFAVGYSLGRYLAYGTAKKIIAKSKLWQRYPLT